MILVYPESQGKIYFQARGAIFILYSWYDGAGAQHESMEAGHGVMYGFSLDDS